MESSSQTGTGSPTLIRGMGLWSATSLNMIDMIGVGPFITMPLVVSARIVPLPARNVRSEEMGTADFVPVYLAGFIFCAAVDSDRMHRPGGICGLLLAGTGYGPRPSRRSAAHSVGRNAAGQLDRHPGNGGRGPDLFLYGAAALPQHHGHRAAVKNTVVWRDGDNRLDHLRRTHAFQRRASL